MRILVKEDYENMSLEAALEIKKLINEKPNCVLGLATGGTPVGTYKKLIEFNNENKVDFSKVTTFNLDEYVGLGEEHKQSYRYFMNDTLFNHINIDKRNTYVPNGVARDVIGECKRYDEALEDINGVDLQILGIGTNGHIGFNEPHNFLQINTHLTDLSEETIKSNCRFFSTIEEVPVKAITMGIGSIMKAKKIILLANGKNKAGIIKKMLDNKISTDLPASILRVHPNCLVILDKDAASDLDGE
ncbi:glucosamine-6-phosphate deaminase [Clostridium rectalis]|uniref:glucosamine-6-phosphate deaminase n=1 Tax=Clostridium rectalis TaxID=2040295 RepID=UPI000F641D00|nr:glucosamine-6-phosphate deaminase [Clostridium rectalis]